MSEIHAQIASRIVDAVAAQLQAEEWQGFSGGHIAGLIEGELDEAVMRERDRVQSVRDAAVNMGMAWDALTNSGPHKLTHAQAALYDQISAAMGEVFEALKATKAEEICWSCEETKFCKRVMYATSPTDPTLKAHRWCDVCAHAHVHGLENEHDCGEGEDA